jgi:hypothetical protein
MRLVSERKEYEFVQSCDIRRWLPGAHTETLTALLPPEVEAGCYSIELGIVSPHAEVVYFATDARRRRGFYEVGSVVIE